MNLQLIKYLLLISTLHMIQACSTITRLSNEDINNYEINNFLLKQTDSTGKTRWEIKSNQADHNASDMFIKVLNPYVYIYQYDKPKYEIISDNLEIYNNGEIIELNNNVNIKELSPKGFIMQGNKLIWNPKINQLNFIGKSLFHRFESTYNNKLINTLSVISYDATWNSKQGSLKSNGPVKGVNLINLVNRPQVLKSEKLVGNTIERFLDFKLCTLTDPNKMNTVANICKIKWTEDKSSIFEYNNLELFSDQKLVETKFLIN